MSAWVVPCLLAWALFPAMAQDASPDRIVAEWMLRMGGSVILEGQRRPITDLADLPTSDFRLHTLNFTGITVIVNRSVQLIGSALGYDVHGAAVGRT